MSYNIPLDSSGDVDFTGTMTANAFVGDGSGLTNLPSPVVTIDTGSDYTWTGDNTFDGSVAFTGDTSLNIGSFVQNVIGVEGDTDRLFIENSVSTLNAGTASESTNVWTRMVETGAETSKDNSWRLGLKDSWGMLFNKDGFIIQEGSTFKIGAYDAGASGLGFVTTAFDLGLDSLRWPKVWGVNASFNGTFDIESGGSQRVYNLGTDGDTDTEYLTTKTDTNDYRIVTETTGTGVQRDIRIGGYVSGGFRGMRFQPQHNQMQMIFANAVKMSLSSSAVNISTTVLTTREQRPYTSDTYTSGTDVFRWANVYSVDGSFSGNLNVESGGSLSMFSLGTDGDTDTESLDIEFDSLNSKWEISTNQTGSGLLRQLWFDASQFRMYESGTLLWIGESNEMRMYGAIVPSSDGLKSVGTASKRFGDVYAVDGDFSGTLNATIINDPTNTFVGLRVNGSEKFTVAGSYVRSWQDFIPTYDGTIELGRSTNRWEKTWSVNGSFSGNLNVESGGTQRLYNLGTEGDTDTEYGGMWWDTDAFYVGNRKSGTGANRQMNFAINGSARWAIATDGGLVPIGSRALGTNGSRPTTIFGVDGDFSGTVTAPSVFNSNGGTGITLNANDIRFSRNGLGQRMLMESTNLRSVTDGDMHLGTSSFRWGNTYSVDGSYSGNLNVESGGSQRLYNLGTDGDTDTEYLDISWDTNTLKIFNKATGSGTARNLEFGSTNCQFNIKPAFDQAVIRTGGSARFVVQNTNTSVWNTTNFYPHITATTNLGTGTYRWLGVYSVNGSFSGNITVTGTVNTDTITGGAGQLRLNEDPLQLLNIWDDTGASQYYSFRTTGIIPKTGSETLTIGNTAAYFKEVRARSWYGDNLIGEIGGSFKLYNLGAEGDADTEYLETVVDSGVYCIRTGATGTGTAIKSVYLGTGFSGTNVSRGITVSNSSANFNFGGTRFNIAGGQITTYTKFLPATDATYACGEDGKRWSSVASVDGDFSGTVDVNRLTLGGDTNTYIQNVGGSDWMGFTVAGLTFLGMLGSGVNKEISFNGNNNQDINFKVGYNGGTGIDMDGATGNVTFGADTIINSGGTQRLYNLGTEGDADTEYLETIFDTNTATIATRQTGAGTSRDLLLDVNNQMQIRLSGGDITFAYNGANKFYMNTISFSPWGSGKNLGNSGDRWASVYGVNGSFTGNLVSEVGGSQRVYNLGTEGDTDTEYLSIDASSNQFLIKPNITGAGTRREMILQTGYGASHSNIRLDQYGLLRLRYYNTDHLMIGSGYTQVGVKMYPKVDNSIECGLATNRWSSVNTVDLNASGDVIMAANVDFTNLPTSDPLVAGRMWNDSGIATISSGGGAPPP